MAKHIFKVLILLIGVSTTVVGQVDTIATQEYIRGDKQPPTFFGAYGAYAKGQLGAGHFTFKNGLVSSNIYSGNGIVALLTYGAIGEKYHTIFKIDIAHVNKLKPSLDYENAHIPAFNTLQFTRVSFPFHYERKIGKTNHFLGAYFALQSETIYNSRIEDSNANYPLGPDDSIDDGISLFHFGPSYFYNHRILGMPFSVHATLPIPTPVKIDDVRYISTRYTFECNLLVYRKDKLSIQISYNWNYTNLGVKQDPIHQYKLAGNSILLTISNN